MTMDAVHPDEALGTLNRCLLTLKAADGEMVPAALEDANEATTTYAHALIAEKQRPPAFLLDALLRDFPDISTQALALLREADWSARQNEHPPVTSAQAAELLNVPPKRVHQWIYLHRPEVIGMIPGRGPGGMVRTFKLSAFRPLAEKYHARHDTGACAQREDQGE